MTLSSSHRHQEVAEVAGSVLDRVVSPTVAIGVLGTLRAIAVNLATGDGAGLWTWGAVALLMVLVVGRWKPW